MTMASAVTDAGVRLPPAVRDRPTVFVVDGDAATRVSLETLIRHAGWRSETFACAKEFLSHSRLVSPSGLELQKRVGADCAEMPIIFVTSQNDVAMTVQAMKAGAIEFLTKPFSDDTV